MNKKPMLRHLIATERSPTPQSARVRNRIELEISGASATLFTFHGLSEHEEHFAIAMGNWRGQTLPLVRVQSECTTCEVLGSGPCACSRELRESLRLLAAEGGVLVYLRQEGRGIGFYNKVDACSLQRFGHDSCEANEMLAFPADARNYICVAEILGVLGISNIRLLSSNPDKRDQLESYGIGVMDMGLAV